MGSVAIDLDRARLALAHVGDQVDALLRSLPGTEARVPHSTWTVRDAAAHLAVDVRTNAEALSGADQHFDLPVQASTPERLARLNARAVQDVRATRPEALATLVAESVDAFLAATDGRSGTERVATPWYGEGTSLDLDAMVCVVLGEVVVHGYDMAQAAARSWPIDPGHASLVLCGVADMLPLYLGPARGHRGRTAYEVRIRGGERFSVVIDGDTATVAGPDIRVDCHISADPVDLMLVAYGRVSQWGPISTGKMVAWGRRPWLGLSFRGLFADP